MNDTLTTLLKQPHSVLNEIKHRFIIHFISDSWGESILLMESNGKAFARIYWYNDDKTSVYLDWLSVNPEIRRKGIGTELQKLRERIGLELGATTSFLWVIKDSWMHDWYLRRGYVDYKDHNNEQNTIWMRKSLL